MHIALTGASGFIGSVTARQLSEAGHTVAALVRKTSRRDHIAPYVSNFVVGEQSDESAWPKLLDGADCIIHNSVNWEPIKAPVEVGLDEHLRDNLAGSIKLLVQSAPRQFIFISSVGAISDISPAWNGLIDEDHPLRPASDYGAYKAAVEAFLWWQTFSDFNRNACALRPCGVYGIDPNLSRSIGYPIIEQLRKEKKYNRPGGGKFVHVDDVAAAIVACVGNDAVKGRPFNLVDCYARWADWAKIAAEIMGIDADIDMSSPPQPKNNFSKEATQKTLGVPLNRGRDGIREHLKQLIDVM